MDDEQLTGGNTNTVVRRGDTVRRLAGPGTDAVHSLLRTLRAAGVTEVPEPFGLDEQGREVLSFLPGTVPSYPMPAWVWSDEILVEAGRLLRRIHDAAQPLAHESATWQRPSREPIETVCLNDVAPYNMVFEGGHLVGVIDVDMASPGPRLWDLAYLAYRIIPLGEYVEDDVPPTDLRPARLDALIAAYGLPYPPADVIRVAADRLDELAEYTDQRAADTGRAEFREHAAYYRRDRDALRSSVTAPTHPPARNAAC